MDPSTKEGPPSKVGNRAGSLHPGGLSSREATPVTALIPKPNVEKTKAELAAVFEADLINIKQQVTCSICDQLLYEPWTLACGHTYCYSCLCNWFIPNKRKKTCPECRTKVKQIPAPSFLVKQLVEIFIQRSELMPSDETIEQHTQRREDEIAEVEKDKKAPLGLFKGTFTARVGELYRDDVDGGVMRCRECGFEHEGGHTCQHCGAELDPDGYDFSDMDDDDADLDDLDSLSLELDTDIDEEMEAELAGMHEHHHFMAGLGYPGHRPYIHFHHRHHDRHSRLAPNSLSETSESDGSDDAGSLEDFVEDDDEEPVRAPGRSNTRPSQQAVITISDDSDDEGGIVSNRIPRPRPRTLESSSASAPSVTSGTDNHTDNSDTFSEADMLRHSGWSPLDQGDDSDAGEQFQFRRGFEYTEDDEEGHDSEDDSDNSDTETIGGHGVSDDEEDDRSCQSLSETPINGDAYPQFDVREHFMPNGYSTASEADDDESVGDYSSVYDRDGDTEMSVSPRASRSVSVSQQGDYQGDYPGDHAGNFDQHAQYPESRSSRSMSRNIYEDAPGQYGTQNLGDANEIVEIEDNSNTLLRPVRRRARNREQTPTGRSGQYNPRISMIFAEHQQNLREGSDSGGLEELDNEIRAVEPGPRTRRMTAYRHQPARRIDPLRSSRSPSATRVIASSSRAARLPRTYSFGRGQAP